MNRPTKLNAMTRAMEDDLERMLDWAEENPSIWVIVITGTGRAFCAGQDLTAWHETTGTGESPTARMRSHIHGFGSVARRRSKKV
jgi:enoyl-CoA hydratase/carnithine racemase